MMINCDSVKTSNTQLPRMRVHLPNSSTECDEEVGMHDVSRTEIEQSTAQIRSGWSLQERENRRRLCQRAVARFVKLIIRPIKF
ncbi:MAG: hypothetical protein ACK5YR_19280 [Pirellula sp.]